MSLIKRLKAFLRLPPKSIPVTNHELESAFLVFNEDYWDGKLDPITVEFSNKSLESTSWGAFIGYDDNTFAIHISPKLKNEPTIALQTLLHEMCHYALPRKSDAHDEEFWNEIKRIAALGAYDGLL